MRVLHFHEPITDTQCGDGVDKCRFHKNGWCVAFSKLVNNKGRCEECLKAEVKQLDLFGKVKK